MHRSWARTGRFSSNAAPMAGSDRFTPVADSVAFPGKRFLKIGKLNLVASAVPYAEHADQWPLRSILTDV